MKRFYTSAETAAVDGGHEVRLDGRPVRTPARRPFVVPTEALSIALAEEWNAQGDEVDRQAMPLNRMAGTAVDELAGKRIETVEALVRYAETDAVCYWAELPQRLTDAQQASWQPLLDWLAERHGVRLEVAAGVLPIQQDAAALARLKDVVDGLDDFRLVALSVATGVAGSLVIGLALVEGRLDAEGAHSAALLDETFQSAEWGEDEIAAERRAAVRAEFDHVERLVRALNA